MAKETEKRSVRMQETGNSRSATRVVVTRMLIIAALDIIGICTLLSIRREAMAEMDFVEGWLLPMTIIFGVIAAASVVWQVLTIVKKVNTSGYYVTPAMVLATSLFCTIAGLVYKTAMGATFILVSASIIASVLFLVYCLYMHIFYR